MAENTVKAPGRKETSPIQGLSLFTVVLYTLSFALLASGVYMGIQLVQGYRMLQHMRQVVNRDTVFLGVSIDGINVSGLTKEQTLEAIQGNIREQDIRKKVDIQFEEREWSISSEDFSFENNAEEIVERAFSVGREGTLEQRYQIIKAVEAEGLDLYTSQASAAMRIEPHVQRICEELKIDMVNAAVDTFTPSTGKFTFVKESTGREVDSIALREEIKRCIQNQDFSGTIEVPVKTIEPTVLLADIEHKYRKLASFSTEAADNENRNTNIRLCSKAFHGARLEPGQVFSLNDTTGRRTTSKGYRAAGAIVNGVLVDEPGGGVCQVSTTLMNAVVRAGLELTERNHHSWPSSYVGIGLDAAIDYPNQDFKFVNNSDGTIFLTSSFSNQILTVTVYGYPILADNERIELTSVHMGSTPAGSPQIIYDNTLNEGVEVVERKARSEQRSETYLHRYRDGVEISKEVLFRDTYRKINAIIRVGTKKKIQATPKPPAQPQTAPPQEEPQPLPIEPE